MHIYIVYFYIECNMSIKQQTPKIRFIGFNEDWVEQKLSEVASYRNGKAHEKDIADRGMYIVVNSKFVSTEGRVKKFTNRLIEPLYQNEVAFVLSDVPNGRAIAKAFLVEENNRFSLNQRIAGITPNGNIHPYFFYIIINRHQYFLNFDNGVSQTNLTRIEVESFSTKYPYLKEQAAIGNLFQNIDQTIALQRRKHQQTQTLKKSLLSKMFPKKGQKQPEIRLEGFSGDWVEKTLRSLVDTVKSYPLSRNFETSYPTTYRYIHYGDIHRGKLKIIESQNLMPNICIGNYELLKKGDLVVADASEDYEGVANPCVVNFDLQDKVVAGLHTIALRPINVDSLYLYYKFSTDSFKDHSRFIATGTKVLGISAKNLLKYESYFPETKEQTAIGQFFKQLDDTISLQAKQLKTLENLKKALLAKMFV